VSATSVVHRSLKKVQQQSSHAALSQDVSNRPAPSVRSRPGRLDAIIVPASRLTFRLQPAINLADKGRSCGRAGVVFAGREGAHRRSSKDLAPPEVSYSNIQLGLQKGERLSRERPER
jgi:hypothetical protein